MQNKILNKIKELSKNPIFWAKFAAYAIPLAFLLYVLYMNFLPFGYHKTFVINVGSPTDTSGEFYLEPSRNLSERKTDKNGHTYRELAGLATAVFKPRAVLKNAKITVEVQGKDVSLIPQQLNFDPSSVKWDHSWAFTKGVPKELKNTDAYYFDGATYFDGTARIELPNSANMLEEGPFTIYAEWLPKDDTVDWQQIVGHYNWELWQNKDSVSFQVGRMNDALGPMYKIKYPISNDFFNKKHYALAIYYPLENGYIDLFIDGNFAGRTYFNTDKIWKDYNGKNNLSFGWTPHNYGKSPHLKGSLFRVNIIGKNIIQSQSKIDFITQNEKDLYISLISSATSTLNQLKLNADQK